MSGSRCLGLTAMSDLRYLGMINISDLTNNKKKIIIHFSYQEKKAKEIYHKKINNKITITIHNKNFLNLSSQHLFFIIIYNII